MMWWTGPSGTRLFDYDLLKLLLTLIACALFGLAVWRLK